MLTNEELDAIERESAADLAAAEGATAGELGVFVKSNGDRSIRVVPGGSWVAYVREQDAAHFARQSPARTAARHAETMALVAAHREALARIEALEAEVARLRVLIKSGWSEAFYEGSCLGSEDPACAERRLWPKSATRTALQRDGGEP